MLFRQIRFARARLYEVRAGAAQKAGRVEDAAHLAKKAEEIFRRLDVVEGADAARENAREAPHA